MLIALIANSVQQNYAERCFFVFVYILVIYQTKIELIIKSKMTRNSYSISYDISREISQNSKHKI